MSVENKGVSKAKTLQSRVPEWQISTNAGIA